MLNETHTFLILRAGNTELVHHSNQGEVY
jgi:hypothetical protein